LKKYLEKAYSQRDYWVALIKNVDIIVSDYIRTERIDESKKTLSIELDQGNTEKLLIEVPLAYHTQINDILLSALVLAFNKWRGFSKLLIDIEGHGREQCIEGVDVSRTVGWFTSIYPVYFDISEIRKNNIFFGAVIKYVKENLRSVKDKGIGFGILKYLADNDTVNLLQQSHKTEILFNYLGVIDGNQRLLKTCPVDFNFDIDLRNKLPYLIEFNSFVANKKLTIAMDYESSFFKESSMGNFIQILKTTLQSLILHCVKKDSKDYTPSDFNASYLSQESLDLITTSSNLNNDTLIEEF
jgi:non-ribosomal peptide synthase protein (TIGR01720 family)